VEVDATEEVGLRPHRTVRPENTRGIGQASILEGSWATALSIGSRVGESTTTTGRSFDVGHSAPAQ